MPGSFFTVVSVERQAVPHRGYHGLGARGYAERGEDGVRVLLDGIRRDRQLARDSLVVVALEDEAQHVALALGEFRALARRARRSLHRELLERLRRHVDPR